jgi:2-C-methyl-D-erythritol 4-phosphate cytidylyltransferase
MQRRVLAVVAAAGEGRRFGGATPKQLLDLAGRPVVEWSIERLHSRAGEVVVALPADLVEEAARRLRRLDGVRCVAGGASRWQSVERAVASLTGREGDLVAIHDGARPALSAEDLDSVLAAARTCGAAVLGRPVGDTIKRLEDDRVVATVDRTGLFRAETPQVFEWSLVERMRRLAAERRLDPTDESTLAELLDGVEVRAVVARHPNPKITRPGDLERVAASLRASIAPSP